MQRLRLGAFFPVVLAGLLVACQADTLTSPPSLAVAAAHGLGKSGTPPPDVVKGVNVHTVYTDDVLCQYAPYNFDVAVDGYDTYTITTYYNPDYSISRITFEDKFDGTVTANGVTLRKHTAGNTIYDYNAGVDTFKGLASKYSPLGGGRPITVDAGLISFGVNGVIKEAGPHPLFDGPGNDLVCTALSG